MGVTARSIHGSLTTCDEGRPEGSWPKGMCIVLGVECNSLLISFAEQLLVTTSWPFPSARTPWSLQATLRSVQPGPKLPLEPCGLRPAVAIGASPEMWVMNGMSISNSPPGVFFYQYHEHLSSPLVWGTCAIVIDRRGWEFLFIIQVPFSFHLI